MIRLDGITRDYNGVRALDGVDLEIVRGQWLGLVGPNGSGKTTMLRIILGLTRASSGTVYIDGEERRSESWIEFKRKIGYMPERIAFYDNLSGHEVLRYFARIRGACEERIPELLDQVGLEQAAARKVGGYSKGMRQRLNLAQALLGEPEVLILDEPTEGLDPHAVRHFVSLLRGDGSAERTVLLSSHRLSELESQADRICILGEGRIKALGSLHELKAGLDLRSRVHVILANGSMDRHRGSLEEMGFAVANAVPGHFKADIAYGQKAAFLKRLYGIDVELADLWIEESNLEEVYFETH